MSMSDACVCATECTLDLVAMRKGMNIQEKDTLSPERSFKNSKGVSKFLQHAFTGKHIKIRGTISNK